MCDPVSIGSLAASAAGAAYNAYETNRTQNRMIGARNAATNAELARQRQFQQQSGQAFNDSVSNFTPEAQAQSLTQQQTSIADAFRRNAPTAEQVGTISTAAAPRVVQTGETGRIGDAFTRSGNRSTALGKVAGWDQRFFDNNLKLNAAGRDIDQVSDFARTSAAVSGLEQNAAYRNAFRPNSGIGDILQFAGQVGAYNAGRGGNIFGGSATPASLTPGRMGALY